MDARAAPLPAPLLFTLPAPLVAPLVATLIATLLGALVRSQDVFPAMIRSCEAFLANEEYMQAFDPTGNWTAYYVFNWWNLNPQTCIHMTFRQPDRATIIRFEKSLTRQIGFSVSLRRAAWHLTMSPGDKEMLIFTVDVPGMVYGVTHMLSNASRIYRDWNEIPKLTFVMKTIYDGHYLVLMDCGNSVVTLSAPAAAVPYRATSGAIAGSLGLGFPLAVCIRQANPNEEIDGKWMDKWMRILNSYYK